MIDMISWELIQMDCEFHKGSTLKLTLYDDNIDLKYNKYFRNKEDLKEYLNKNNIKFDKNKMVKGE